MVLASIFFTLSFLSGLFIVWQLYWTDYVANSYQSEKIEEIRNSPVFIKAKDSGVGVERYDDPPVIDPPLRGQWYGLITIPSIHKGKWATIAEGSGLDVIDYGYFGHYAGTTSLGDKGNVALAAHRRSRGSAMRDADKIKVGDPIVVETSKYYYVYRVTGQEIVNPWDDYTVSVNPQQAKQLIEEGKDWRSIELDVVERQLTVTTCHPLYGATHRLITHSTLEYWMDKTTGKPKEIL